MKKQIIILLTAITLTSCATGGSDQDENGEKAPEMTSEEAVKFEQYMVAGETLFLQYCSSCHNAMGTGLGELYPPLAGSDYMEENYESVICLIRNGKNGEIVVNGKTYNGVMPALPMLTDLEVAEIATYIYNSWGHNRGLIPVTEVSTQLKECEPQS